MNYARVIDANLARLSEGTRVIEDLARFEFGDSKLTVAIKDCRNDIKSLSQQCNRIDLVTVRDTHTDPRAGQAPPHRRDISELITANIKRATESCRVLEECMDTSLATHIRYRLYDIEQLLTALVLRNRIGRGFYVISDLVSRLVEASTHPHVRLIQYRHKAADKQQIYQDCCELADKLDRRSALWIVNDFVDIAIGCGADGVHTGQDDIPVSVIRKTLGPCKIIGRTTHSIEQGKIAVRDGADYVSVGPIWETPSKPGRPGIGFDYLSQAHDLSTPFVAIGGINTKNISQITPYQPPLVGIIREQNLDELYHLWQGIPATHS